jgi:hypothetical protein
MEKKTATLSVHMDDELKSNVLDFAELNGVSASEFICSLLIDYRTKKFDEFRLLQKVFESQGTDKR